MALLWSPNIMRVINLGSYNLGMLRELGEEKCMLDSDGGGGEGINRKLIACKT